MEKLSTRQAARRVGRTIRTIEYWRADGMPVYFDKRGHMYIDIDTLLDWYRKKTLANPVHKYRVRKAIREQDLTR